MDRIFIEELVVFAQIGVYDWGTTKLNKACFWIWKWHGIVKSRRNG